MARDVRPPLHRITQIDSSSTERVFQNQKSPAPRSWCCWCVVYCKTLRLPLRSVNGVEGMFATLTQHPAAPLSPPPFWRHLPIYDFPLFLSFFLSSRRKRGGLVMWRLVMWLNFLRVWWCCVMCISVVCVYFGFTMKVALALAYALLER